MDGWTLSLLALCVVGLAAVVYGALADRATNRRRAAAMVAPPSRTIPQFSPDRPAPRYLSELQARQPAPDAAPPDLGEPERQRVRAQLAANTTVTVPVGCGEAFVSDRSTGWAVLDQPRVLVCADGVGSIRELITVLEKLVLSRTPLVIIAPSIRPDVLATLEVNHIQRRMTLLALVADDQLSLERITAATGATPVPRTDLQASYVTPNQLGACERWVSDRSTSWLVGVLSAEG